MGEITTEDKVIKTIDIIFPDKQYPEITDFVRGILRSCIMRIFQSDLAAAQATNKELLDLISKIYYEVGPFCPDTQEWVDQVLKEK